ncbi:MBL fold metallo-hydrolase [Pseudooceanicola sp. LIPI14-2-Ac024]|uniref:MBL fold metallo-hydrolase n=1 Tax=Pseudooceanicola sp. LIPI14-2-Ac024 TaxID=3344875 RepID=UPI0035D0D9B6
MSELESHRIGGIEVTVLEDGHMMAPNSLFPDFEMERARAAAEQAGIAYDGVESMVPIRGFLLRDGANVVIVDAGSPAGFGETTGRFHAALAAAGVTPDEVTHLVMTHLHSDHVGGMIDGAGAAVFRNAELIAGPGDWDYFTSAEVEASLQGRKRALAGWLTAKRSILPYAERRREGVGQVLPGISLVPLPGHTPGHSGVMVSSGGAHLLIWGDTIHCETFQMAEPDWGVLFDVDPDAARASRRRIFERAASEELLVTGPHVRGPGLRRVERMARGYRLVPAG